MTQLGLMAAIGMKAELTAQGVWVEGTKTLYFVYQEPVSVDDAFDGKTVTAVWRGTVPAGLLTPIGTSGKKSIERLSAFFIAT